MIVQTVDIETHSHRQRQQQQAMGEVLNSYSRLSERASERARAKSSQRLRSAFAYSGGPLCKEGCLLSEDRNATCSRGVLFIAVHEVAPHESCQYFTRQSLPHIARYALSIKKHKQ